MKRLNKKFKQSGFTLLETLLAVAIMVIISTMLLNGFAATMGYSYYTSVYTRAAASNYSSSLNTLSDLHSKGTSVVKPTPTTGNPSPTAQFLENNFYLAGGVALGAVDYGGADSTSTVTIEFSAKSGVTTLPAGTSTPNSLNAVEFAYTAIPAGIEINGVVKNETVAANRKTFFYIPKVNYDSSKALGEDGELKGAGDLLKDAYLGHVNIYKINQDTSFGSKDQYIWGYLTDPSDANTFVPLGSAFNM